MNLSPTLVNKFKKVQLNFGQNVVLDELERTKEFKSFQSGIKESIKTQISLIIDDDFYFDQLVSLSLKIEANNIMVRFMDKKWSPLNAVFDAIKGIGMFFSFFEMAGESGGQSALDKMGIEVQFNMENKEVTAFLQNRANLLIQSVDETTKEQIANLIERGREMLLTNFELSQFIIEEFENISESRAEMIAHTELANAVSAVELETFNRNQVKEIRWVTSIDERVCPICEPLHNEIVSTNNNFSSEGFSGMRPPAHPNCRCFLEPVLEGFDINNNKIIWTGN